MKEVSLLIILFICIVILKVALHLYCVPTCRVEGAINDMIILIPSTPKSHRMCKTKLN